MTLNRAELRDRFVMMMGAPRAAQTGGLFERLQSLDSEADLPWLSGY
jgi:hypothetical protein